MIFAIFDLADKLAHFFNLDTLTETHTDGGQAAAQRALCPPRCDSGMNKLVHFSIVTL